LTEADGSTRTILTGNFDNYNFTNLAAGQTVVLTVRSKRYRFLPQIITLTDDFNEVNFVAKLQIFARANEGKCGIPIEIFNRYSAFSI